MKEYDGFIHIGDGLWYCEEDGSPWSTRRRLGISEGWSTDGPLKKITGKNTNGYYQVRYEGKKRLWHRVIFQFFNGYLPKIVDHLNRIKDDNRIENLREATRSQNNANRKNTKGSSSQYLGVWWDKDSKKWRATIRINHRRKHLGYFDSEEDAARAYDSAAKEYHKEFANLNFPE